jgi:two-component system nitrate/nitrite response regulator NarL
MGVKAANSRRCRAKQQEDSPAVETLVRQLVAHAENAASAPDRPARIRSEDEEAADEVLFACEVDGVRCVLARPHHAQDDALSLSPREHEVARMIAKGYPNKIIASVLDISVWTVSTHLRRIFAKLGVTSRAAMVTRMIKRGKL